MNLSYTLILNAVLLLGVGSLNNIWGNSTNSQSKKTQAFYGLILGILMILLMRSSFSIHDGLIYDTRNVLVAITSLYFEPITILITVLIGTVYRVWVGGVGTMPGVITIIGTMLIGYTWKIYIHPRMKSRRFVSGLIYGFVINIAMLLFQLSLPLPLTEIRHIILGIAPVILTIYPLTLAILSELIHANNMRLESKQKLKESEAKYKLLFQAVPNGILYFDISGTILDCNDILCDLFKRPKGYILNKNIKTCMDPVVLTEISKAFKGESGYYEGHYQTDNGHEFYSSMYFTPVKQDDILQGGIVVVKDLTVQHQYEDKIANLEQMDNNTNFYYRKVLDEQINEGFYDGKLQIIVTTLEIEKYQFIKDTLGYAKANDLIHEVSLILNEFKPTNGNYYQNGENGFLLITEGIALPEIIDWSHQIKEEISKIDGYVSQIKLITFSVWKENDTDPWEKVFEQARSMMQNEKIYAEDSVTSQTIDVLMASLFEKSPREQMHSERVSNLSVLLAEQMNFASKDIAKLKAAAKLHDIGKLSIDYSILDKNGPLTDEEYKKIQTHSLSGARILSSVQEYKELSNIIMSHHEKYNGSGYPNGLIEDQIPIEARIISVADSIDAIINDRPYRKASSLAFARSELLKHSGKQFDPVIVQVAHESWNQIELILNEST